MHHLNSFNLPKQQYYVTKINKSEVKVYLLTLFKLNHIS